MEDAIDKLTDEEARYIRPEQYFELLDLSLLILVGLKLEPDLNLTQVE